MADATSSASRRGRPAAATREDVLEAAMHRYLRGRRVDVQAIANELGLGRTTIYRWFGSRDELIGEVLARAADPLLKDARAGAHGGGGGKVQPRVVAMIADLILKEVTAGTYERPSTSQRSLTPSCASARPSSSTMPSRACAATSTD
jgi:AcrR family transcriptional regulator